MFVVVFDTCVAVCVVWSAAVVLGEGGEGGLGFPGHVGVGVSVAALEHLDDARAGQIQVVAGIAIEAVRKIVERLRKSGDATCRSVPCSVNIIDIRCQYKSQKVSLDGFY